MLFKAALNKSSISVENSIEGPLNVKILAITPGTMLPLRDVAGNTVAQFEATEQLIKTAVLKSRGGLLTVDHEDPINSRVGIFSKVVYEGGFLASAQILCPKWAEIITSGEDAYSGLSVEGSITGNDMEHPESIDIHSISLLSNEKSPQGGACARGSCKIEVLQDEERFSSIEAAWDGSTAEKQIWNYVTDENGAVVPSKAKKCFLKVEGDSTKKGSYSYPYVTIVDGKPVPNREGLVAALKFASGAMGATKDQSLIRKIKTIMSRNGMDLPPSLQARLEQKSAIENGQHTIIASVFDPTTDEILDSQKIIIKGEQMTKVDEPGTPPVLDWGLVSKELGISSKDEFMAIKASADKVPSLEKQIGEVIEENKTLKASASPEKVLDWDLVSQEIGVKSKEDFGLIKNVADKVPSLEKQVGDLLKETESLKSFKIETEKKWLTDTYPPAITKDIDTVHAEFIKDPAGFVQKYAEDAVKFAASKSVKLQGSAIESELTEEARKMQARKEKRDGFLKSTGGPVIR